MVSSFFEKNIFNISQFTTKVVYGFKRGLDGRIFDSRLAIHANVMISLERWMIVLKI